MSKTEKKADTVDELTTHLLNAKRKHDEDKNVESEEIRHLQKGTDYLTTFLLQQGIKEDKVVRKQAPPKLDELKKMFIDRLVKSGYVTVNENGRTILTNTGQQFLNKQTKNAAMKVELAKLKNLEYRRSLERKNKYRSKKRKKKR